MSPVSVRQKLSQTFPVTTPSGDPLPVRSWHTDPDSPKYTFDTVMGFWASAVAAHSTTKRTEISLIREVITGTFLQLFRRWACRSNLLLSEGSSTFLPLLQRSRREAMDLRQE